MTGRPRVPKAIAEITGYATAQPSRFKDRADPKIRSLGPAPKRFTADQVAIWNEFNSDFPWLGRSDRRLVELAALLTDQMQKSESLSPAEAGQMRLILSSLGGTPVDRSKVFVPDEGPPDPADEFLN